VYTRISGRRKERVAGEWWKRNGIDLCGESRGVQRSAEEKPKSTAPSYLRASKNGCATGKGIECGMEWVRGR
jgi:hypothetical protein